MGAATGASAAGTVTHGAVVELPRLQEAARLEPVTGLLSAATLVIPSRTAR